MKYSINEITTEIDIRKRIKYGSCSNNKDKSCIVFILKIMIFGMYLRFHSNQKNNNTELKAILEAIKQCIGVNKKYQYIQIHIILLILILNGHVNGLKIIGK